MRRIVSLALLLPLVLISTVVVAGADEAAPRTPAEVADAVELAVQTGDDDTLKTLARLPAPDPWVVADLLCSRQAFDAAEALAAACSEARTTRLADYVAGQRRSPTSIALRESLDVLLASASAELAVDLSDGLEPTADVTGIRIRRIRAQALRAAGRLDASAALYLETHGAAERFGWLAAARACLAEAAASLYAGGNVDAALTALESPHTQGDLLYQLASLAFAERAYARARTLLERRLALDESIGDRLRVAETLTKLGLANRWCLDFPAAAASYRRALKIFEELGDRQGIAVSSHGLAYALERQGERARALPLYEQAVRAFEAIQDPEGLSEALLHLGAMLGEMRPGDERVVALLERSIALAERVGNAFRVGFARTQLGAVLTQRGEIRGAIDVLQGAVEATTAGGDHATIAHAHSRLAYALAEAGRFAEALEHHAQSIEHSAATGSPHHLALMRFNLGQTYVEMGLPDRAQEIFEALIASSRAAGDRQNEATASMSLGVLLSKQHEFDSARSLLERTLELNEALGLPDGTISALANLGILACDQAEALRREHGTDAASPLYERALALHERVAQRAVAAGDRSAELIAHYNIAWLLQRLRAVDRALGLLEKTLAGARQAGLQPLVVSACGLMAETLLRAGKPQRALRLARKAADELLELWAGHAEEGMASVRSRHASVYEVGAAAALASGDVESLAYFLEAGRAGSLVASLGGRDRLRQAALPTPLLTLEDESRRAVQTARAALDQAQDGGAFKRVRDARKALAVAEERARDVSERIRRQARVAAGLTHVSPDDLATLKACLGPHEALLLLALYEEACIALVVTPEEAVPHRLADLATFEEACAALVLRQPDAEPGQALARVRSLLKDALALPEGVTRVHVSPMGPLSYVPFALLLPEHEVVNVPSGTTLRLLLADRDLRGDGVLALGDPDYGVVVARRAPDVFGATRAGQLAPLPATRDEAKAVGDVVLLGREATERGLREHLADRERWRAVHLACHGLVDVERPTLSSLALTPEAGDDGYLTALEVLGLEIPADLVVLSACETGRGRVYGGEGIVGLSSAFLFAGAPRLLVSLWKVDDEATRALMEHFYALWTPEDGSRGMSAAAALRAAQAEVRKNPAWRHPYYWAPWVLWGLGN